MKNFQILPELACHFNTVELLGAEAFGPGRFTRTAFRLREGLPAEQKLSFVAVIDNQIVGSVRVTRILIGGKEALLLGPLVVEPASKNLGIGSELMTRAVTESRAEGYELMILVGDEPYYRPFGFKHIPLNQITLPGPVDPARFLYCDLVDGAIGGYSGMATRSF